MRDKLDTMISSSRPSEAHSTASKFLGGRLQLLQSQRGHKAGTDAVLLAAATPIETRGLILDIGAGAGAVGLGASLFAPNASVGLVELDSNACALARRNVTDNGLSDRVRVYEADLLDPSSRRNAGLVDEQAELVLTNPPYLAAGRVRISPDPARALAHVSGDGLGPWVRASLALLRPGGTFVMIHRADALAECLASVEGRLGAAAIMPVAPRAGEAATRILLRGIKGSKAPLALLAPLVLHETDGRFTLRAEAIHRGQAAVFPD
jgi:tRNA1(Val) A37 N6-methylase TrmN6